MKTINKLFFAKTVAAHDVLAKSTLVMAKDQRRVEQREFMKGIKDLHREIWS